MSLFDQRRLVMALQKAGVLEFDEDLDDKAAMRTIGSIAERAFVPKQHLTERDDLRLAHEDLPSLTERELWTESEKARFIAAWADSRNDWVWDRLQAIQKEQQRRRNNGG
jgi:hypothetical protein